MFALFLVAGCAVDVGPDADASDALGVNSDALRAGPCGNGRLDWGERCDPTAWPWTTRTCTSDCKSPPRVPPSGPACTTSPGKCPGSNKCWNLQYGCDECSPGYVWREIRPLDHVCVSGESRSLAATESAEHAAHLETDPAQRVWGPNTCAQGFVWRDAFQGDEVCVTVDARTRAGTENAAHVSHTRVGESP